MDANSTTATVLPRGGLLDRPPAVAAVVLAATAGLFALALLVFCRRVAGAMDHPAPVGSLVTAALVAGACCWTGRWLWRAAAEGRDHAPEAGVMDLAVAWMPSVAVVLLTFGLSWPLERLVDWLVWMPLWVADALWRKTFLSGPPLQAADPTAWGGGLHAPERGLNSGSIHAESIHAESIHAESMHSGSTCLDDLQDAPQSARVMQQLTRLRDHDGTESIVGSLQAEFAPGQRTAELYVGFCPPLRGKPLVEVEQTDGPPARLTAGQILPHGARIDIRLDEPAIDTGGVTLDFYASSEGPE